MEGSYPQFVLFGDSIIQFSTELLDGFSFTAALQNHFSRRLDVVNRGLSGYNSDLALEVLPKVLEGLSPGSIRYIIILFGANDAVIPNTTGQHVPLSRFKSNIESMITHPLLSAHKPKILLVTPPPIVELRWEATKAEESGVSRVERLASVTAEYAAVVREIGNRPGRDIVLVDLWTRLMDEAVANTAYDIPDTKLLGMRELGTSKALTDLVPDGLHLSGRSYRIFYDEVLKVIEEKWPGEGSESHQWVFPYWKDMLAQFEPS